MNSIEPNVTTRREFSKWLMGVWVASTAAAFLPAVAPDESAASTIAGLIEQHRRAWQAFEDFCGIEDHECKAEYYPLNFAEEAALNAVCSQHPQTLADAQARAAYLDAFTKHSELTREQERLFFRSFQAVA